MRVIAIFISIFFLSSACYAQQARQMQKTGTAARSQSTNTVITDNAPSATRQMMPVSSKPVKTANALATPVPADNKPREMKPVKGQQAMHIKN